MGYGLYREIMLCVLVLEVLVGMRVEIRGERMRVEKREERREVYWGGYSIVLNIKPTLR